jgi:hypothetical protein
LGYYLIAERVDRLELAGDRPHSRTAFERHSGGWHSSTLVP